MQPMSVEQFTSEHAPTESSDRFQLENAYTLDVAVDGRLLAKAGSMIAYTGEFTFSGKSSVEGGVKGFLKDTVTGEGTPVMEIEGQGHVYLADDRKMVQLLDLEAGDAITVNGDDILAFDPDLSYEITTIDSIAGATSGGLTNVALEGPGRVAITSYGEPLVLDPPVTTDPSSTVAWTTATNPNFTTNKLLEIGQTSGEAVQMEFTDEDGFVVVQPTEEH